MKKVFIFILIAISMVALVSCASTTTKQTETAGADVNWTNLPAQPTFEKTTDYKNSMKILGKDGVPRPQWVISTPVSNDYYYAVGMSELASQVDALKLATVEAKNIISEWVNVTVREQVSTYQSIAGEAASPTTMKAAEILTIQVSESVLAGCKQEDVWVSKDGVTYVLVSIPVASIANQMNIQARAALETNTEESTNVAAKNALNAMYDAKSNANLK